MPEPITTVKKPLFSICILAKNEQETLPKLVARLQEFVERGGDAVLVDTGSTDQTAAIAESFGWHVFKKPFTFAVTKEWSAKINKKFTAFKEAPVISAGELIFDYGTARNFADCHALHDMVLVLDCDELPMPLDIDQLNETIAKGFDKLDIEFQDNPMSIFRCDYRFYNRQKYYWYGVMHEMLKRNEEFAETIGPVPQAICRIEHHQTQHEHRGSYLAALAWTCYYQPEDARKAHCFGRELMQQGRPASAIAQFGRHLELDHESLEAQQSMIFVGDCYRSQDYLDEAVLWYQRAFNLSGKRREPLLKLADLFYSKQDALRVAAYASAALALPYYEFYANRPQDYGTLPHHYLYWAFYQLGLKFEAATHWTICRRLEPGNPQFINDGQFFTGGKDVQKCDPISARPDRDVSVAAGTGDQGRPEAPGSGTSHEGNSAEAEHDKNP